MTTGGSRLERAGADLLAGLLIALLLAPQAVAFASLAGLPARAGLQASLLPLVAYAAFGRSPLLSVGPVAVTSLMTAAALRGASDPEEAATMAGALALMAGILLLAGGLLRLGALSRFLSRPVISGFITGTAILIIAGQLPTALGLDRGTGGGIDPAAATLGLGGIGILVAARWIGARRLRARGPHGRLIRHLLIGVVPLGLMIASAGAVEWFGLASRLAVVGEVSPAWPVPALPSLSLELVSDLGISAMLITFVIFASSIAVAQTVGPSGQARPDGDAELRGLGVANLASALAGGLAVAGSLSRTAVAWQAGAQSRLAGLAAAGAMVLVMLLALPVLGTVPMAVVAALLVVVAWGMVDVRTLRETWRYDRAEGAALLATALGVILAGVETGLGFGIVLSLAILIRRASRPHIAVVGRVPGTEHFRSIEHREVEIDPAVLMVRVDENLFFGNSETVERRIEEEVRRRPRPKAVVLIMSSVSYVDATAIRMLGGLDERLASQGIALHLAEVKRPVEDRLARDAFLGRVAGRVHLTAWGAFRALGAGAETAVTTGARDRGESGTS